MHKIKIFFAWRDSDDDNDDSWFIHVKSIFSIENWNDSFFHLIYQARASMPIAAREYY